MPTQRNESPIFKYREQIFLVLLLAASFYGVYKVMKPYLHVVIVAAVFASLSYPLYVWMRIKLKGRKNLAALATVLTVGILVVGPLVGFSAALASKAQRSFESVQKWMDSGKLKALVESERVERIVASAPVQKAMALREQYLPGWDRGALVESAAEFAGIAANYLGANVGSMLGNLLGLTVSFALVLFTMFYFLRDGSKIINFLMTISPMSREHEERMLKRIQDVSRSAIVGTLLTAAAQAVLAMIGFGICGIEWFFWGIMLGIASLIPVVGTALVWIPAVIYLLATGDTGLAVFLAIYCVFAVGSADNFLRPYLMEGDTGLSSMAVFFSILGGMQLFGLIGVLYGPLIFGLCAVLLYIYQMEIAEEPLPEQAAPRRRRRRRKRKPRAESESNSESDA